MKRWISIGLPFVGLAIFLAIVYGTGPARILAVLGSVLRPRLLYAPVFIAIIVVLRGLRWRYLMRPVGIDYPLGRASVVWMIGFFASAVTPAKAGDAVRALYLRDETDVTFGEAFLTVFMDRLWDLVTVLCAGVVTILVYSSTYIEIPSVWVLLAGAGALLVAIYLMTRRSLVRAFLRPLFHILVPEKYKERFSLNFHSFYDSLQKYWRRPGDVLVALVMTLAYWAVVFIMAYYVARLLGIDVTPGYMVVIMPIVTLVELLPISISGLGTRDATVIYFFSQIGVNSAHAVGFSIAYLLIGTYLTSALGFVFWLRNPVKLGDGG